MADIGLSSRMASVVVRLQTIPCARAWPFEVVAVDAPEIVFGREPLMSPVRVQIATPKRMVIMDIDAFGELTVVQ